MQQVPLSTVPNQKIAFNVDGAYWQLYVYTAIDHMCMDVTRNGEPLVNGVRCFGGIAMMPFTYMMNGAYGNFLFDSDGDWEHFGSSCNLYYLSRAEFDQYNAIVDAGYLVWP